MMLKVDCTPLPTEARRQMSQEGIESVAYTRSEAWLAEAVAVLAASEGVTAIHGQRHPSGDNVRYFL